MARILAQILPRKKKKRVSSVLLWIHLYTKIPLAVVEKNGQTQWLSWLLLWVEWSRGVMLLHWEISLLFQQILLYLNQLLQAWIPLVFAGKNCFLFEGFLLGRIGLNGESVLFLVKEGEKSLSTSFIKRASENELKITQSKSHGKVRWHHPTLTRMLPKPL